MSDLPLHRTMQDDEIDRLKADLTAAKSEIESLQSALVQAQGASACDDGYGRVCRIVSRALEQKGSSWLLRKQAEAFEDEAKRRPGSLYSTCLKESAQRLRQQADEAERAGGEK